MNEKSSCPVLRGRDGGDTILLLDGKTQTAVEYAYRYYHTYRAVLWVNAASRDALITSYVDLAALLTLPEREEQDQNNIITAVKRWFTTHEQWLLIVDNADD